MAKNSKVIRKEIALWKKRLIDSKKVLGTIYKDVQKEARVAYREVLK